MRSTLGGLVAATLAACISLPTYHPTPQVSVGEDTTGTKVTGPGFTLHFAGGDRFHLPDELKVGDSTNLIGHDPGAACYDESGAGFKLAPTARVSADGDAPRVDNRLSPVLGGPAVVQIRLDWATSFVCNRRAVPGGTSTFTVFPDGQIVRHDLLRDPNNEPVPVSMCECPSTDSPGSFIVSAYWTFAKQFDELSGLNSEGKPDLIADPTVSFSAEYGTTCLESKDYQVASAWVIPVESGSDRTPSTIFGTGALIGHRLEQPIGRTTLELQWDVHGSLFLETTGCRDAFKRAAEYLDPKVLRVNGRDIAISPLDGIYGGDMGIGGTGVDLQSARATLTGKVNGPFAVWLQFSETFDVPRATRAGATGEWYVPQRVDDHSWILWFRDPLLDGEQIVIEPP